MVEVLMRTWPMLLVRGLLACAIGAYAMQHPTTTMLSFVFALAALAATDGAVALVLAATSYGSSHSRRTLAAMGIAGILAAGGVLLSPRAAVLVLLIIIASWAVMRGLFAMLTALELRREIHGEWLMFTSGVLSIVFGFALVMAPVTGLLAVGVVVAVHALAIGLIEIALAFQARRPWPELAWRR